MFSASTNQTLANLDYLDPLQGKLLGAVAENIDVIANSDPAGYNSIASSQGGKVWAADKVGTLWFNTSNTRFMNYHQNDVNYNSQYWGRVFPGSNVTVYSWVASNVIPAQYTGPGIPYDVNSYSIRGVINAEGLITPVYYYWVRNTNIVFSSVGKTLADTTLESYISQPQQSGISYFTPLLPSVFALYNSADYINAKDTVLHIGYSVSANDDASHNQYSLIRDGYAEDFLSGVPGSGAAYQNHAAVGITEPIGLYNRMLDSMCGVDNAGGVVPDPLLPKAVQTGILARPRQGFFYSRFGALENYLQYANTVLAQFPILEIRNPKFLFRTGQFFDTTKYWNTINWWAVGYNDNTKSSIQVPIYADLSTLNVPNGTIVTVAANGAGNSETYIYSGAGVWTRIGLANGTIEFSSKLWDYAEAKLGFGDNFFDTTPYDEYPSEETRYIVRALNEEIYTNELLIFRNKSLILLFEYIQSETIESQNYLDWLNKTSFIDVSHTIRELVPLEVFRSDNQLFLEGYLNEVKPYHVLIKEFIFKYTRTDIFEGDITDFDLPAQYNSTIKQFVTPELVYANPSGDNQYLPTDPIWQTAPYSQWFSNYGLGITGQDGYQISVLTSYMSLNSTSCYVDNVTGFPVSGTIILGTEVMSYASKNLATNELSGISRGINGTTPTVHIPGEDIYINLPAVLVLNKGRGYTNPPKITAYIDTSIYPAPRVAAQLEPIMSLDSVVGVNVINPGEGYAVLPKIIIDPAFTVLVDTSQVNTVTNTIGITTPVLQTGDLILYSVPAGSTPILGLVTGQHYYVNLLEITPSPVFALYASYATALKDHDRIILSSQGTGPQHFSVTATASSITSSLPTRENSIALRFDRTSYTSQVIDWTPSGFYGSFYAGTLNNSAQASSSAITLRNTKPPISQILASARGASFEILNTINQQTLTWSSRTRNTVQTYSNTYSTAAYQNAIRINPSTGGAAVEGNIGSTTGFYIGMPVKFVGSAIGTTLTDSKTYYVKSLVQLPNPNTNILEDTGFTVSATVDNNGNPGDVFPQNTATIVAAGLTLYVGELTNLAVLTINYDGIRTVTKTVTGTNNITVQLTPTGLAGTTGFYLGTPIFFTGDVFGGVVENEIYYVITIIDNQTFTASTDSNPVTFNVSATSASSNSITCASATGLAVNNPIIFTGINLQAGYFIVGHSYTITSLQTGSGAVTDFTVIGATSNVVGVVFTATGIGSGTGTAHPSSVSDTFGNVVAGQTYYVREIFNGNTSFSIAATVNGDAVVLTNASGSFTLTNQVNALKLTNGSGSMTLNVGLPVSPGQINGQEFTFYETSTPYNNVPGTVSNLLTKTINSTLATVNRICILEDLTNVYNNLQFNIATGTGGLTVSGEPYTVSGSGTTTVNVTSTSTSSSGNWLTIPLATNTNLTDVLYVGMPIVFTGTSLGGISIGLTYYVYAINASPPSGTGQFSISEFSNLSQEFTLSTSNGTMVGTGDNYLTISGGYSLINSVQTATFTNISPSTAEVTVTNGSAFPNGTAITFGSYGTLPVPLNNITTYYVINSSGNTFNVSYSLGGTAITTITAGSGTHRVIQKNVLLTQQTVTNPVFDVSYMLGGYSAAIISTGSGYAVNNNITIPGTLLGGSTHANDLVLTVNGINSTGGVTSAIASGTPGGTVDQYYLKVLSETQVGVYSNPNLTAAVSGENFPYMGTVSTSATATSSVTNRVSVTSAASFNINDAITFTGSVFGNIVLGKTYYIKDKDFDTNLWVTISATIGGTTFALATSSGTNMTMAKSGDYVFLPEPFFFNPSIVKYNNRLYQCIVSNNDPDFIFGKWELLTSGDKRLNALDRIIGYYQPTVNMPGVDLTQLVSGITYPNSTYLGNKFAPANEYALDTILTDQPFYQTGINLKAITWNGLFYIAGSDTSDYSSINISQAATLWSINKLANTALSITDLIYAGGNYIITTNNNATPILTSSDGYSWNSNENVPSQSLNNVTYHNGIYVAVGNNIVSSTDLSTWTERYAFTNGLNNAFNSVTYVTTAGYTGFVAVGLGQQLVGPTSTNYAIVYTSPDAYNWNQVQFTATHLGFNSIASNSQAMVAVGDGGIIYTSFNGTTWFAQNSTVSTKLNNIIWDSYNNRFIVVGDSGTILTGTSNGITWSQQPSSVSAALESVVWNNTAGQYVVVGLNNTILTSSNAITWTVSATFETLPSAYTVQGDDFTAGYGPEELVPGVIADSIMMTVATRPGTNWDETVYQHVGYNTVSKEITPTTESQVIYSFKDIVTTPAQLAVFVINRVTNLSTSLYKEINYTVDWANKNIILKTPITYIAPGNTDRLRIDVYEVGNGDQLVKSNTDTDALRLNTDTGFQEIYVNANYTASIYQGSGVVRPDTSPIYVTAINTSSTTNAITCDNVSNFVLNSAVTFTGAVFGNIVENQVYYVKSIGRTTNRIVVSATYNLSTGTAGETFLLTDATGVMDVVIAVGTGLPWTPPSVLVNGNSLVLGTYAPVLQTTASTNSITTISTGGLIVNTPVKFSKTMFGNITPNTTYYVHSIVSGTDFTISATQGGPILSLVDAVGGATVISNDYAFGIANNGITASLIFAKTYDVNVDYLTYTILGETLPAQYGYTLPQVQVFNGNGSSASFALTNYVGGNNPNNAIVEINGLRQTAAAYTINSITNTILFNSPPPVNSTVAVTTYNQTQRQYLNTQYNITGSTIGSASITVSKTTSTAIPFDTAVLAGSFVVGQLYTIQSLNDDVYPTPGADTDFTLIGAASNTIGLTFTATGVGTGTGSAIIAGYGFDAIEQTVLQTAGSFVLGDVYSIVTLGTTTNTQWNTIAGTTGITYAVGSTFTCANVGTGLGNGKAYAYSAGLFDQALNYLTLASGSTNSLIINSAIVFQNVIGGVVAGQTYYITQILNSTDFVISEQVGGLPLQLSNDTGSMTSVVNKLTVSNIVGIDNTLSAPTVVNVSGTVAANNSVICNSTTSLVAGQDIIFKSSVVTAGSFVNTYQYEIITLGTTDWNAIGYSGTPVVGGVFTTNGVGSGTGTALLTNLGGIGTLGQVYYVRAKLDDTHFTIQDQYGNLITLTNTSGNNLYAYSGGLVAVRIITGINHNFTENELIRIDGVGGSTQLNNNTYYVKIISDIEFDLYNQPYNPAYAATNYPVTGVSAYTSGGYAWLDQLFTITDTVATRSTANGNRITIGSTGIIVPNTPVLFTTYGANVGDNILGGILAKTQYYVYEVRPTVLAGNFIVGNRYQIVDLGTTNWNTAAGTSAVVYKVGDTFTAAAVGSGTGTATGLQEFTITANRYPNQAQVVLTDATGSINVTEFEQVNVDRLWVTVNGYRVPSSSLRLNPFNNLSILTTIQTGDQVIVTSMMPTATPNEEVYLLNVSTSNQPTVYRANTQTRTWLTRPLKFTDTVVYLDDLSRVTDNVIQNVTCPAAVDGKYNIGLSANKNAICHNVVYNVTTATVVNPANYKIVIVDAAPILQISSQVSAGNSLIITSVVGRLVYINGEQIAFAECDLVNNTISQLTRGANGTGVQNYTPIYTEVYGIIPSNVMSDVLYSEVWNPIPGVYNTTDGDPLQIAYSQGADFLRTDRN